MYVFNVCMYETCVFLCVCKVCQQAFTFQIFKPFLLRYELKRETTPFFSFLCVFLGGGFWIFVALVLCVCEFYPSVHTYVYT